MTHRSPRTRVSFGTRTRSRHPARPALRHAALAAGLTVLAGCGPDRVAAPHLRSDACPGVALAGGLVASAGCPGDALATPRPRVAPGVAADLAALTDAPTRHMQSSSSTSFIGIASGHGDVYFADDFTVPEGATWRVDHVALSGGAPKPPVTFAIHVDQNGTPGDPVAGSAQTLSPATSSPSTTAPGVTDYLFTPGVPITLGSGHYWLVVRTSINTFRGMASSNDVVFRWQFNPVSSGRPAMLWLPGPSASWVSVAAFLSTAYSDAQDFAFALFGPVVPRAQAITFPAITPNPATIGGTAALGATASSGLAVTYDAAPASVCTLAGSTLTYVGVGTCTVTARQAGSEDYLPAAPQAREVAVDYAFAGFAAPVDNGGVWNVAKAGQAIPLRWRLTDATGAPVTTLAAVSVRTAGVACALGGVADQVEDDAAAGGSGLQNLGDGHYQLNWKTPTALARSCQTLRLDLGEGSGPRTALFQFTR
jgi:hypothetical protein